MKLVDSAGYNANNNGTPAVLATAATNTAFRGVALAPENPTPPPTPNLSINNVSAVETNSGTTTFQFTVSLSSAAPAGGVTFDIATADDTATSGDNDYATKSLTSQTIAAGNNSYTFDVTVNGDTKLEGDQTFFVNVTNVGGANVTDGQGLGTIQNDDSAPTLSIADLGQAEGNSANSMLFTVTSSAPAPAGGITFTFATAADTVGAHPATAGTDYDSRTDQATIPENATQIQFSIGVIGDTDVENDETFLVDLSAASVGSFSDGQAVGTITNDDNVTPSISIDSVSVAEGNTGTTNFSFTVSSNVAAPPGGYTLSIASSDGSASAGSDYTAIPAATTVTIDAGTTSKAFVVQVNGDTKLEGNETFTVTLSNPPVGTVLGTASGTGTINNDDSAPALTVGVVSVDESLGTATFNVNLSGPAPAGGVTFTANTADGTATAGSDYTAIVNDTSHSIAEDATSTTVDVTIANDTTMEKNETFTLNLSAIANASNTTAAGTGTILDTDAVSIGALQGDGLASPYATQFARTTGNVVTAVKNNAFAMQDPVGDGNPNTSDGFYVFTGGSPGVAVGDVVTVSGNIVEFNGTTEFSGGPVTVTKTGTGTVTAFPLTTSVPSSNLDTPSCNVSALPPPATQPNAAERNWECLESMLVGNDFVVVGATVSSGGADGTHTGTPASVFATVAGAPRPFREPGIQWPGVAGLPVWDGNPEIIEFYPPQKFNGAPTFPTMNAGQSFTSTSIVGYFSTGAIFELYPVTFTLNGVAPDPVQPVADLPPGAIGIGSQNMLHLYDTVNDPDISDDDCTTSNPGSTQGSKDYCPTPAQFAIKLAKLSRQVRLVLKAPAVVAVQEVENINALNALATQISADDPALIYTPYLVAGHDVGGIDVGFLVRSDVTVNSVKQIGFNTVTTHCSSTPTPPLTTCFLNDRPPLLLDATLTSNGYRFAILAIHNRSLSSINAPDPAGNRVRHKRLEQAQQVADIVQHWQTGDTGPLATDVRDPQDANPAPVDAIPNVNPGVPLVVIGDYNAYEFTDGYVDVTGQIKGTAVEADNMVWAAPLTAPTLCEAGLLVPASTRYSFMFDGYVQDLDHSLFTRRAWLDLAGISYAHGNADASEASSAVTDPSTASRSADHDGQVVFLRTTVPDRLFADDFEVHGCQ